MNTHDIKRIVLTGGPCAGKTTALSYCAQKLEEYGYYPIFCPEIPTLLMMHGITPRAHGVDRFQEHVVRSALFLEQTVLQAAEDVFDKNPVIIFDRGIVDCKAYMRDGLYKDIIAVHGLNEVEVRDGRYDSVFHLRTAALGAEEFYSTQNNEARLETLSEAQIMDEKTLACWIGHPHLGVVENHGRTFDEKMKALLRGICHSLGIPEPLEIERKFLVGYHEDPREWNVAHKVIDIEQTYIMSTRPDVEVRVRKRGHDGMFVYYRTEKRYVRPGVRVETERQIDEREYTYSLQFRDPKTIPIKKKRICFPYKGLYLELDMFESLKDNITLLEVELTSENELLEIPPFIHVENEVTTHPEFSNYNLARM